jgi:hypothetical protein
MTRLYTADEVVRALGGLEEVCRITGANIKQAWHWHGRAGMFPATFYVAMTRALRARGYQAPARLWNQKGLLKAA